MDLGAEHGAGRFLTGDNSAGFSRHVRTPPTLSLRPHLLKAFFLTLSLAANAQLDYVDPSIGSVSFLLEPTRPTVSLPNSLLRMYPVRKDGVDDQIRFFPLTIISHR